ncbi:MAG TPA: drug/metabolite exporter YedA [Myxococcaceae bacterium]|nr:drug/metabolite exporter YedA [Myxococcaceae bacterium]
MLHDPSRSRVRAPVLLALGAVYVIWGSTYLGMRIALESYPPFVMGAIRFLLAGGALYAWLRARGTPPPTRAQWGGAAIVGFLLIVVGNGGVAVAEQWVASSLAAVMVASMPLWAALFAGMFGRWPRPLEWAGLAVGTVGVVMLNLDGDLRASVPGAVALVLAPMGWALGSTWGARLPLPTGLMASAAQMLAGGAMFASLSLPQLARLEVPSLRATAALLFLAVFGSLVAYSAYQYLLRTVQPALATSYAYVNPVVAVLLGVLLAGEHFPPAAAAGTALILAAVALVALRRSRSVDHASRSDRPAAPLSSGATEA